jgi:hypothetical protein
LTGDGWSAHDFGTGNGTTMSGDNHLGQFFGSGGAVVSTGWHNDLIITGTLHLGVGQRRPQSDGAVGQRHQRKPWEVHYGRRGVSN